jgi:D-glycero-alpha-D-manno-heptose 1-phosphate guanylyltransferase
MEAIVLAGGFGTRLQALVSDVPKPMAPIAGRPFLELLLDYWIGNGVTRFVLSVGYLGEKIAAHFGARYRGVEVALVSEREPLGTGGGLLLALEQTSAPTVLVLNGDTFFDLDFAQFLRFHQIRQADCSLSLFRSQDTARYLGVQVGQQCAIVGFGHESGAGAVLVNGGAYLMRRVALKQGPWQCCDALSLEAEILPHALASGWRLYGWEAGSQPLDIGLPQDYRRAADVLAVSSIDQASRAMRR